MSFLQINPLQTLDHEIMLDARLACKKNNNIINIPNICATTLRKKEEDCSKVVLQLCAAQQKQYTKKTPSSEKNSSHRLVDTTCSRPARRRRLHGVRDELEGLRRRPACAPSKSFGPSGRRSRRPSTSFLCFRRSPRRPGQALAQVVALVNFP